MNEIPLLRPARISEVEHLSELAVRSKGYWGYSAAFMDACRDELAVSAQDIDNPNRMHVVCEADGSVVGYFAIEEIAQDEYELEALFVEPQHIGCGYGRALIEEAKNLATKNGGKYLLIQGDPNAEKFYVAAGGLRVGERESGSIPGRFLPIFRINLKSENAA